METRSFNPTLLLLTFGLVAFGLAGLSIADMLLPRPYDGVVLKTGELVVMEVMSNSGADRAGIRRGDQIVGIGREKIRDAAGGAAALNNFHIGKEVPYLVRTADGLKEIPVRLGRRQLGDGTYLYACALGFCFFFVGLFVLVRQPGLRASQVFFLVCGLFLVFLVCWMRPRSYSTIDTMIRGIGAVASLLLPAAFLHFYMIFPRPAWMRVARARWRDLERLRHGGWALLYLLPALVFLLSVVVVHLRGGQVRLIGVASVANWWLLAVYMILSLVALGANWRWLEEPRERRGVALVLAGTVFGLTPFLVASLVFADYRHSTPFFLLGVLPLALVPITFTYAIVRFQLLDVRVILRRSLLYTVTTVLVTSLYAGGIVTFNAFFRDTALATSVYFPILFALVIVLLFEPLRRRLQVVIDNYFYAGRSRLQRAIVELGEAMAGQVDLHAVVEELVGKLPQLLGIPFAALYLVREGKLSRAAGPESLPAVLPLVPKLHQHLQRRSRVTRLDALGPLALRSTGVVDLVTLLAQSGVAAIGDLATPRRHIGMVLLSARNGQIPLEKEELELLENLLHQASLGLETSLLLAERTQQAELQREMEIAATIQARLLPERLRFAEGWRVAAVCRPAHVVGGDFFAQLPAPENGNLAVVFGDVAGKSVSGALLMMAAHEALHALAMTHPRPAELFALTNCRLYGLGKRNFVALGYFVATPDREHLRYLVAGQPPPLLRRTSGEVWELPLPEHRIPVGALPEGDYCDLEIPVGPGELVLGYSDGVTETRSPEGELFGTARLQEVVAASSGDPREAIQQVLAAVDAFTRGGLQYDDLTLVAVGRQQEST